MPWFKVDGGQWHYDDLKYFDRDEGKRVPVEGPEDVEQGREPLVALCGVFPDNATRKPYANAAPSFDPCGLPAEMNYCTPWGDLCSECERLKNNG